MFLFAQNNGCVLCQNMIISPYKKGVYMKKFIIALMLFAISVNCVLARDYAKLQEKEMKHAQKYGTTKKYLGNQNIVPVTAAAIVKDPKIIKLGDYEVISKAKYDAKIKSDNIEYEKFQKSLGIRTLDNYNAQAKGEDYYRLYRIAEKIIRANKLDYINWRIAVKRDAEEVNAYSNNTNYICITTALYDSFCDNEDALAFIIGHEMGHALLGHSQRKAQTLGRYRYINPNSLVGAGIRRKYLIDSKNMEHAADIEGAKLAAHAGYDLNAATDVMRYFTTLPHTYDYHNTHPNPEKRISNIRENAKYFPEQWVDIGKYNIYNSSVMSVKLSSDRRSIIISAPKDRLNPDKYYRPETMAELYTRFGYMYYLNGQFTKSLEYFGKLFDIERTNTSAYLYASYAAEGLYKNTGNSKYLQDAKNYANYAHQIDSKNKYIKEQMDNL